MLVNQFDRRAVGVDRVEVGGSVLDAGERGLDGQRRKTRRWPLLAVFSLLFASTAVVWGNTSAGTNLAPSPTPTAGSVKYYIVGDARGGQREYLFEIAAKTLGNGNRYLEIFGLNRGRLQPDGERVVDAADIRPGWILLLPPDAAGPWVRVGKLPNPAPHSETGTSMQEAAPGDGGGEDIVRAIGLTAVVVVLCVSLWLLRRGTRITLPRLGILTAGRVRAEAPRRPARFQPAHRRSP